MFEQTDFAMNSWAQIISCDSNLPEDRITLKQLHRIVQTAASDEDGGKVSSNPDSPEVPLDILMKS